MSRARAKAPRIFVCTCTSIITVSGRGPRAASKVLTAGAQVDFDEIVGDTEDGPVTLEQALGAFATTFFIHATPSPAPVVVQDDEE